MAKTKPLTKGERAWLAELQEVLNRCPTRRIGFSTIGDSNVSIHDAAREREIDHELEKNGGEWVSAASRLGADFDGVTIDFPNAVQSISG